MKKAKEQKVADQSVLKKANRYFFAKVAVNVFLMVLGAVFISVFLRHMQEQTALVKQSENNVLALTEAVKTIEENDENSETLERIYHEGNQNILDDLKRLFESGLFDSLADADNETRSEIFADVVERSGVEYLFLLSDDGKIVLSGNPSLYGVNPAARAYMTQENLNRILLGTVSSDGTIKPVVVGNQYGGFYFYSTPYKYKGKKYILVLGADSSVLDVQISSLKDISVVLKRAAIGNDGFLFAVDKRDSTFLYYRNGDEILTGQNALMCGLSQKALVDGYSGYETINGKRYYCTSKTYGEEAVICAVADTSKIFANDKYVLFWSITGFILVMIMCLAYAVIVRNDFVRRAVETERVVLNKKSDNPIFFDKTVFKKIFPLLIAGVLVLFGISFYTQTLLEITQGIERSDTALEEITGRYEESLLKREIIENYYNSRFISKAKLISFLIEEDPSVLNEESDRYHSVYDKNGNKQYILDDEGNRLKAVGSSAKLQELCDANEIDSIYVFDQDGHTIGTNTENWYFTISHNEEDQSYPFLQIIDGRTDTYIQEEMENDLGENTQFIGVAFNYYTTVDEDGNTVYISQFDYETAMEEEHDQDGRVSGITPHRALLQIGLKNEMSHKLLESTDVKSVLSTNLLDDGFIVMFDTSEDHLCVYSPVEVSIGRSAEELGVSSNAFSGNEFYAFSKINGVDYFSCFRYIDQGYFVGTAISRDQMYQMRGIVALITSLMSFLLILILSGTVTITNKEEEELYAAVSYEQSKKGLNSAIFNIVLPSGRDASTVKAAARWDNRRIPWRERSPEQKLGTMVSLVCGLLMIYVIISAIGANRIFDEESIIRYILSGQWDRGLNIFAFTSCVLVLITIALGVELFRIPVRITSSLLGARGETVGHLLLSVVKYGGALGAIFYCLYLLGIDSSKLLASAGILSLIIGLGAQSLIKDIIAGIFIVFEGEFRVGDIITIGDYRGTVMDIGLRTTKIVGLDANIKIFNNSEISGVLNMTQEASIALTYISVEYGQDIDYVEATLNRELPRLKEENPLILDGPTYLGVSKLADSGVEILVMCRCNEADIKGVTRYLNKGVLQIFYRNGINVPFPNITVSQLNTAGRKTIDDLMKDVAGLEVPEGEKKE